MSILRRGGCCIALQSPVGCMDALRTPPGLALKGTAKCFRVLSLGLRVGFWKGPRPPGGWAFRRTVRWERQPPPAALPLCLALQPHGPPP